MEAGSLTQATTYEFLDVPLPDLGGPAVQDALRVSGVYLKLRLEAAA